MGSDSNIAEGLAPGQLLAEKYLILRKLGSGGMCDVFEAEHVALRQAVAVKALKPELAAEPDAVARFAREARAAAKLRSHNVAKVFDVDTHEGRQPYITMELLVGHDLGTELAKYGSVPLDRAVDYVRQAAAGMAEAHALGIVHRDLKPENLFLTDLGVYTDRKLIKILDFGIAKHLDEGDRRLTAPDAVFGTVDYMSPEQIRSASAVDHRSDIWSLGVILYELLTGRVPFTGDARSVIAQIVSDPVPVISQFLPTLPPEIVAIVMKCLQRDPAARFQSAEELRSALDPFAERVEAITSVIGRLPPQSMPRRNVTTLDGESAREVRTNLSFETQTQRKKRGKRWIVAPIAGAILCGSLALAFFQIDRFRPARHSTQASVAPPPSSAVLTAVTAVPPAPPADVQDPPETASSAKVQGKPHKPAAAPVRSSVPPPPALPRNPKHL